MLRRNIVPDAQLVALHAFHNASHTHRVRHGFLFGMAFRGALREPLAIVNNALNGYL